MRTTLLLGAGASRASIFALPTMRNFFGEDVWEKVSLGPFLKNFYSGREPSSYNLEEVLAYLELSRVRAPLWQYAPLEDERLLAEAHREAFEYVSDRLRIGNDAICTLHKALIEALHPRDTIITLNYDLIVENAALSLENVEKSKAHTRLSKVPQLIGHPNFMGGQPPSLMPNEEVNGFYLKLHGSLDWIYCPTQGCSNNVRLFASRLEKLGEFQIPGRPCRLCGAPLLMFIIPPVASKRIEDRGRLAFLWNLALRELRDCSHLVIVGVSLAPSDFELRWLLKAAMEARPPESLRVTLVDPDKVARSRLQHHLGDRVSIECQQLDTLEQYVQTLRSDA